MANNVADLVILFFIYSVVGYITEIITCSIGQRKMVNRGFLFGPYLPIYGFGALTILFCTQTVADNVFLTFLVSAVSCSILEYITGFLMKKIWKIRWWDYREATKYTITGYVSVPSSTGFGIGGVIIVFWAHPIILGCVEFLPEIVRLVLAAVIAMVMLLDTIASSYAATQAVKAIDLSKFVGDQTNEIKKACRKAIKHLLGLGARNRG